MNPADIARLIALKGEQITLRRLTGTARIPFDVQCNAVVQVGVARLFTGDVEISADQVMLLSGPLEAAGWRGVPRHGDVVLYADGRSTEIQGQPNVHRIDATNVAYVMKTLGG